MKRNNSQAGQALQDVLLQLAGASLAGLELLLVSPDTLRLTTEGRAEVERSRGSHLGQLLHPEVPYIVILLVFFEHLLSLGWQHWSSLPRRH